MEGSGPTADRSLSDRPDVRVRDSGPSGRVDTDRSAPPEKADAPDMRGHHVPPPRGVIEAERAHPDAERERLSDTPKGGAPSSSGGGPRPRGPSIDILERLRRGSGEDDKT